MLERYIQDTQNIELNVIKKKSLAFNPVESIKKGIEIIKQSGVHHYAVIGGIAIWAYVEDESKHRYTKDVDFAVLLSSSTAIEECINKFQLHYNYLKIGGIGIREQGLSIDFIDRRLDFQSLFTDALNNVKDSIMIDEHIQIPLVSKEYLIAMKMVTGEVKDEEDVKNILKNTHVDYGKARQIVETHLGAATRNRLDFFAREVGLLPPRNDYDLS
ncbi:MAG: hypothetical protein HQK77_09605 [Desulfobacterales bacterium]|nr:hypothetical protein [Desulfobacterales bacterium]